MRAVCILPEESAFGWCEWSAHFGERTHARTKSPAAWDSAQVWIRPSEARYHTVYQSADKLPQGCVFLFFWGLDLSSCLWLHSARQFAGALDDFIYPFFQVPSQQEPPRFASLQVAINHAVWSWNGAGAGGQTDGRTGRQWAAAVSGLDGLRQPTGEPHADDALSPPCNAKGLIRVLSITFQAKLILTFKPGWSPCTLSRPSEYFVTGVGYKKQQYESTSKDKTDLQLKEHFATFKRFYQLEIEWKISA